jgi:hypothetical protein
LLLTFVDYLYIVKQKQTDMTTQEILIARTENGNKLTAQNEAGKWFAISREGYHMVEFNDGEDVKFYINEKSWAKRVSQLIRTGK